jgi:hypothetical protein
MLLAGALFGAQLLSALPASAQQSAPGVGTWQPGPNAAGDNTYAGSIDQPVSGSNKLVNAPLQLSGWIVDTTAQGWNGVDDVQVLDAPMDLGGRLLAHPILQTQRPDVAAALNTPAWAAAGFSATVPPNTLLPGSSMYIYAHTPAKGWWYKQATVTLSASQVSFDPRLDIETPTALASVHAGQPLTVRGTAIDRNAGPNQGTGIDRVQVYFNGDRKTGIFLGDAALGKFDSTVASYGGQFTSGGWELTFQPASQDNTISDNQICKLTVYAHSSITGQETSATSSILIELP